LEGDYMKRRAILQTTAAGLVALAAPNVRAQPAKVIKFVPQADLAVLDPIWTTATVTRNHGYLVFDTLYGMDAQYRIQPQMVEGHVTENDGKLWRLTLREGLRFHDGEPVRAQDVVPSLQRWGKRDAFGSSLLAVTDELSVVSDRVVQFRLKKPFALLPDALGKSGVNIPAIMPERLARTDAMTRVTEMVGSGPYRFMPGEWRQGSLVVYQRFDGYVPRSSGTTSFTAGPKHAHFDRVEWHIIPDPSTAANALVAGEVDWWERAATDLLPLLKRNRNIVTRVLEPTGALQFLRFNQLHPPFDNPAIRRAILGAIHQTDYMQAAGGDDRSLWDDHCGAFTPGTPMASEVGMEILSGPRNFAKVKRDLAAAGYNGERVVMLGVSDVAEIAAICQVASDMLTRIGLNLDRGTRQGRLADPPLRLRWPRHGKPRREPRVARQRRPGLGRLAHGPTVGGTAQCLVRRPRPRQPEADLRRSATPGLAGRALHPARPDPPRHRLSGRFARYAGGRRAVHRRPPRLTESSA
jgi:peptide/nickel transport system substrate-binding protein